MSQSARAVVTLVTLVLALALGVMEAFPVAAVAGPPTATTEAATAVSYTQATLKGKVNPEGVTTKYWFEYGKTEAYGTKIPVTPASIGAGTEYVEVSQTPTGLAESTEYHFRIVAENEKEEKATGADAVFTTCGFRLSIPKEGAGSGPLSKPFDIAVDSKGNIWVSDTGNNRIVEFNSKHEYLSQFGKAGSGKGEFKEPKGIAIDSVDYIWVVDSGNNRVQRFKPEGTWSSEFGKGGTGTGEFKGPTGIDVHGTGPSVFVADTGNNRVQKFNSIGKWIATFGKEGTADGELKGPQGVTLDGVGRIWITDTGNNRVQKFNQVNLKFIAKFGGEGTGDGKFKAPIGIVSDFQEKLWVVDSGNHRAQKFDIEGNYLDKVGKEGSGAGQFLEPTGIDVSEPQDLLIDDSSNALVDLWRVKAEPPTANTNLASDTEITASTVHAGIKALALPTIYWFEYGETTAYGTKIPVPAKSVGEGLANVPVEQTITGLKEGTTYNFRAVAESPAGVAKGINRKFTTLKRAITEPATAIKATEATLKGKVNPLGSPTTYWFEYGKTTSYGTKIPVAPESVGSGSSFKEISQVVTGLAEGTTYHYKVVAANEAGEIESAGVDKLFTTLKLTDVTTEAATSVTATQATLNGKVNPLGSATSYWFEYGETEAYGTKIPFSAISVGSGTTYVSVSQIPTGLVAATQYHYRIVAESDASLKSISGTDKTFKTVNGPDAITEGASAVKGTQATLNGKVNPLGSATTYWFEYGKTTAYGSKIPFTPTSVGSGSEFLEVSQTPAGLIAGTEYHYRVVAKNEAETAYGADRTLKTIDLPKVLTEPATAISSSKATLNAEVNPEGAFTTYWFEYGKTESYGTKIPVSPASVGSGSEFVEVSQVVAGLTTGAEYHFRVVAESEAGTSKGWDLKFKVPSFSMAFGTEGSGEGQFQHPAGISIDAEGNLWVVDRGNDRLVKFDDEGNYLDEFGEEGSSNGQLLLPSSAAIDAKGNIWVVDTGNDRVEKFDEEGEYLAQFGEEGSGEGQFESPEGIAIDTAEGEIWIADTGNGRLQKFDEEGKILDVVGAEHLGEPTDVDICLGGDVWVTDWQNDRISEYSVAGEFVKDFGEKGSGGGRLNTPDAIDVAETGLIWVLDEGNSRVQEFTPEGEYISQFGTAGSGEGEFSFGRPTGIASDSKGDVWIADSLNNRVQKWIP